MPRKRTASEQDQLDQYRPQWHWDAKCLGVGVDHFFPRDQPASETTITTSISVVRRAQKVCETCPVMFECFVDSLRHREEHGVWAGVSGRSRKKILARMDSGEITLKDAIAEKFGGETDDGSEERGAEARSSTRTNERERAGGERLSNAQGG